MLRLTMVTMKKATQARLIFLFYLLANVTLVGCIAYFGWTRTWSAVFVPTLSPPFADMRFIQGAVISSDEGLNPQISNPHDPLHHSLNYPLVWVKIGQALNLPDELRFNQLCSLVVMGFVSICGYILFRFPSFGLLTCLFSTATLLSIERGNVDLIIFSLVFVFALVFPRTLSPIPLLVATMLKLYPVFLLGTLLIKRQLILFFTSLIFALAIFAYMSDQLPLIYSNTPSSTWISYGFPSLALHFWAYNLPPWMLASAIIVICSAILMMAVYFRKIEGCLLLDGFDASLFLAGASIYVGTFIISSNYDYRLIFLIFCVPFVEKNRFPLGTLSVILIIVAMNELILPTWLRVPGLAIVLIAKVVIFVVLSAYLAAFIPTIFEGSLKKVLAEKRKRIEVETVE